MQHIFSAAKIDSIFVQFSRK